MLEVKTFKEVHAELEQEAAFLLKNHDTRNFSDKANILKSFGFTNSIATRMYDEIARSSHIFEQYRAKYNGMCKFILKPQLERICEKYNLFVREPEFFLGDIPEKNISDMSNFKVYPDDLFEGTDLDLFCRRDWVTPSYEEPITRFAKYNLIELTKRFNSEFYRRRHKPRMIEIAAVKPLFNPAAFERSNARIIDSVELEPKSQVDLDPIVLCKTLHGYLIVTAWGDEANDELVVNQNLN